MRSRRLLWLVVAAHLASCSDTNGEGAAVFMTYGEDFIEKEIGAGGTEQAPVVDGWTIRYERFLVVIGEVAIAEGNEPLVPSNSTSRLDEPPEREN